ncbi:putative exporter [Acidovorax sp. 69]|uniref:MMPL family transporter n=1 Tax=Acidovorax sp. 69 TaxID=2035202 RepID=UPI000C2405AF|nr:MMPL family transporter [Acidovorax sp. 69]PJI98644.1 putative exporter [Acidovorax sp. 69]
MAQSPLNPVADTPPGWLWRAAAIAWLLVIIAVGVHQWQFWMHDGIDTDVMALLPVNEQAPDVALATEQLVGQMSRQVVLLLGAGEWAEARAAAQVFRQGLVIRAGTRLREDAIAQKTSMQAALDFYQPWRERLLTPEQRALLTGTPDAALVQKALQDLYQPAVQARLSDWVSDPLGLWTQWWTARGAQSQARPRDGELWVAADGQQWAVLEFTLEGSAFRLSGEPVLGNALLGALADVQAKWPGARMVVAGVPLHAEAAAVQAHSEINTIGWGSLAGVMLLAWFAFRSLRPVALVGVSLLVGCAVALSVTAFFFEQVHLLTLVFGASLVGVAEDYGIHYFASRQGAPRRSPHGLMRGLMPALWLALGTSAIAYLALGAAAFPGLRQMAVFSVVGLTAAMLTVVCWFPWLDRGTMPHSRLAQRIGQTLMAWPRWRYAFTGSVVVCLALALMLWLWGGLRVQDDVRQLQNGSAALVAQQRQVGDILGLPSPAQFYLVQGHTPEQVLQREEELKDKLDALVAHQVLVGYSAVSDWVPSARRQGSDAQLVARAHEAVYKGVNAELGESFARAPTPESAPLTVQAWLAQPISAAARPLWLGERDGSYRSLLMLRGVKGVESLPALAGAAQGLEGVTWVDKPAEISGLLQRYRISMTELLLLGHVLVLAALWLRFGRRAWRAWMPTVMASLAVVCVFAALGAPWQLFNVLALMLLLGVGIDYGIFLQEHEDDPHAWLAVVIGAGSTWLSFGLLGLSETPALKAFGLTLMLGLPLVLVLAPLFRGTTDNEKKQ